MSESYDPIGRMSTSISCYPIGMKNPIAVALGQMKSAKKAASSAANAKKATEGRKRQAARLRREKAKAAAALRRAQKAAQTPDPPA